MSRFTPHTEDDVARMLEAIGVDSIGALFADIAEDMRPRSFEIPEGKTEREALGHFNRLSLKNRADVVSFLGGGYYDHFIPSAVDAVSSRSEFYTSYTPYQAEASQGTLQAMFEYQTMIAGITGLDYANASLYDGSTALYEAVAVAVRTTGRGRIVIDRGVNPLFLRVLRTYVSNLDIEINEVDCADVSPDIRRIASLLDGDTAAVVVQNPNFFGTVDDFEELFGRAASMGIVSILVYYPVSLGILKTPGEMKADIAVAEGQSLGLSLSFGGPYLGLMSVRGKFLRKMPGRIVGETVDRNNRRAYVLTLQAREQHIRRERATSNICTNEALCALRAVVYLSLIGREGFRRTALINLERAEFLKKSLGDIRGISVKSVPTFNEFTIVLPMTGADFVEKMLSMGFAAGLPASLFYSDRENYCIVCATEKRTGREIEDFCSAVRRVLS